MGIFLTIVCAGILWSLVIPNLGKVRYGKEMKETAPAHERSVPPRSSQISNKTANGIIWSGLTLWFIFWIVIFVAACAYFGSAIGNALTYR